MQDSTIARAVVLHFAAWGTWVVGARGCAQRSDEEGFVVGCVTITQHGEFVGCDWPSGVPSSCTVVVATAT